MILDGHVHVLKEGRDRAGFARRLRAAGVSGAAVISRPPPCFPHFGPAASPERRLDDVLGWCQAAPDLFPVYWIDPTERDAVRQVRLAVRRGVAGFKVICGSHEPGDRRAMRAYRAIADADRPILFHSGILWDGQPSSAYNRPAAFEPLLEVAGLRFSLAHISWPWCEECVAVYGKFLNARQLRGDAVAEMFIDLTPGTPLVRRREALQLIYTVGYDVARNVFFGTDGEVNHYQTAWTRRWIALDRRLLKGLRLPKATVDGVFAGNLRRFLRR